MKALISLGSFVAVEDAAELDCALRGLRERHAGPAALARDPLVGHDVVFGPPAEVLRGDLLQFLDRVARRGVRRARRAHESSGCRPTRSSTADSSRCRPRLISTFSQGMPIISAATRWQSENDSVPRLPTPVWMYIRPSGLMTKRPSKPTEPALYELIATPLPRTFVPWRWPFRAFVSSHLNICAPLSSASLRKQLVV